MRLVFVRPFSVTVLWRVSTVQRKIFSSGQVALYTTATGVEPAYPPARSSACSFSVRPVLRNRTMVAPWAAKARMDCFSGTGVRPGARVMMTVWLTSGRVYSVFREAAAPQKALTPGQTS